MYDRITKNFQNITYNIGTSPIVVYVFWPVESVHAAADHRLPLDSDLQHRAARLLPEDPVPRHAGGGQSRHAGRQGYQQQREYHHSC